MKTVLHSRGLEKNCTKTYTQQKAFRGVKLYYRTCCASTPLVGYSRQCRQGQQESL